jgi:hypothetical protein
MADQKPTSVEPKHLCAQCEQVFATEQEYLDHKCEKTGFQPTDPRHLGEEFKAVSEAAVARGEARKVEDAGEPA